LRRLQIEFGEKCNVACIMCSQDHKSKLELDDETIVENIEIPRSCRTILFFGGEPLVIKSAKRFFDHCAAHNTKISFQTNGTAISEEMAAKIARHCRTINVSLNAASKEVHEIVNVGSRFEKVLRNIRRMLKAKADLNGEVMICGHMTIVQQNMHEIASFIKKRREFGFQYIDFSYDRSVPGLLAEDPALKCRLAAEVRAAVEEEGERPKIDPRRMLGLL
jgi:MoaA/NifB/PqqE/SkfB family radical SAM enzyme